MDVDANILRRRAPHGHCSFLLIDVARLQKNQEGVRPQFALGSDYGSAFSAVISGRRSPSGDEKQARRLRGCSGRQLR
jgi:hypothetical protein